jgi:Rps23 Pro-64 3,4-dihydroxylase Tpa1-like proline 4-hydroxylase
MKMAKLGTLTEFTLSKIREELGIAKEKNYRIITLPRKARRVKVLETGQIFESIKECAQFFGVSNKTVYSAFEKGCKLRGHNIERIY